MKNIFNIGNNNIIIIISIATFVALIMPLIKKIAFHINAIDIPNERKIHTKKMPRLGGLGIYLGLLLGYMLYSNPNSLMNSILISSFIILLTGIIDDIKPIEAKYKFLGQFIAASILIFYGEILLVDFSAFGFYINMGKFTIPATYFFILGCINSINLIDGMDGLAGGISCIYFYTIGIIAYSKGIYHLEVILCFIMVGACIGFLIHNFYPAKIFMGDSGSMLLGLIISVVALLGFKSATVSSLIIPLLVLSIPILDTTAAIIRRQIKGESISTPDKEHIHHQFLNRKISQRATVLFIYLIDILFALASIIYAIDNTKKGYFIYGIILILVIIFVYKTNIIFDNKDKKHKKEK